MIVDIPLPMGERTTLNLKRFEVTNSGARFVVGSPSGDVEVTAPDVVLLRGTIGGDDRTRAFFAVSSEGIGNGYFVIPHGGTYFISQPPEEARKGFGGYYTITQQPLAFDLPDGVRFCGVELPADLEPVGELKRRAAIRPSLRMAYVALDSDHAFYNLFGSVSAAQAYALTLLGAVSDIYIRDVDMKLVVNYVRVWPSSSEPFSANNISGFRQHWLDNEDPTPYNYVHLLSGRRDLSYGGVAYVGGTCSGNATYGISGFLNGSSRTRRAFRVTLPGM